MEDTDELKRKQDLCMEDTDEEILAKRKRGMEYRAQLRLEDKLAQEKRRGILFNCIDGNCLNCKIIHSCPHKRPNH